MESGWNWLPWGRLTVKLFMFPHINILVLETRGLFCKHKRTDIVGYGGGGGGGGNDE